MRIIEKKNDEAKRFIKDMSEKSEDIDLDKIQDCIFIAIYDDTSSEVFHTSMRRSNLVGYMEVQKQIMIETWLNQE